MNAQILIVDDEVDFCCNVVDILDDLGHQTEVAHGGFAALECAKQRTHDLFLLDFRLPCMTGADLYEELKIIRPATPVIMVTAFASNENLKQASAAGIRDVLEKPVDCGRLISVIQRWLPSRHAMNFVEEYPDAFAHFTTCDGFMKGSGQVDECTHCEGPATWFHKALGLYFCSRECYKSYDVAECRGKAGQGSV
jgi:CheY-like chemotaxis protein